MSGGPWIAVSRLLERVSILFSGSSVMDKPTAKTFRRYFWRLYQLDRASKRGHQSNYFEQPTVATAIRRWGRQLKKIELCLKKMDSRAWRVFKRKTVRAVTIKDKWGWHSELFDRFDEASAYCHLKKQGYSDIQFIPEDQNAKTPDLWANGKNGPVLVEVKSIRESDDENDYLTSRGKYEQEKGARVVEHSLGDPLRSKLENTICKAAQQLRSYQGQGREANKRIVRLYIRLDSRCATKQTVQDQAVSMREP